VPQSIQNLSDHLSSLVAITAARWQSPHGHDFLRRCSSNRHAAQTDSTLHVHPNAVTYFCDDAGSYKTVEDSARGIRRNLERLA
jgi:hypothetical protein